MKKWSYSVTGLLLAFASSGCAGLVFDRRDRCIGRLLRGVIL